MIAIYFCPEREGQPHALELRMSCQLSWREVLIDDSCLSVSKLLLLVFRATVNVNTFKKK